MNETQFTEELEAVWQAIEVLRGEMLALRERLDALSDDAGITLTGAIPGQSRDFSFDGDTFLQGFGI